MLLNYPSANIMRPRLMANPILDAIMKYGPAFYGNVSSSSGTIIDPISGWTGDRVGGTFTISTQRLLGWMVDDTASNAVIRWNNWTKTSNVNQYTMVFFFETGASKFVATVASHGTSAANVTFFLAAGTAYGSPLGLSYQGLGGGVTLSGISTNTSYMAICTFKSGTMSLYIFDVNGLFNYGTSAANTTSPNLVYPIYQGFYSGSGNNFNGYMGDIMMFTYYFSLEMAYNFYSDVWNALKYPVYIANISQAIAAIYRRRIIVVQNQ